MIKKILDDSKIKSFVNFEEVGKWQERVNEIHKMIHEKTGKSSDFLGWVDWPVG
jgi:glucose-6-phosphate isomerase